MTPTQTVSKDAEDATPEPVLVQVPTPETARSAEGPIPEPEDARSPWFTGAVPDDAPSPYKGKRSKIGMY